MATLRVRVLALAVLSCLGLAGAPGSSANEATPSVPAYVRRGNEVDPRYRAYSERLARFYETLSARVAADAPDLSRAIEPPKPTVYGYQVLPKLVPDGPPPQERPRAKSKWYTWPWTERLIERELEKIGRLEAELDRTRMLPPAERRVACEKAVAEYPSLREWHRIINSHVQYNRLWQAEIAHHKASYDRRTVLTFRPSWAAIRFLRTPLSQSRRTSLTSSIVTSR